MKRIAPIVFAAALVLSACQSASETIAEQLAEQVEGVENVEFDADTGTVKVETDSGLLSVGGGELPGDFPIPVPDGGDVLSVFTSDGQAAATLTYPAERYEELVAFYDEWTSGQPDEWVSETATVDAGGQTMRSSSWYGNIAEADAGVFVTDCVDITGSSEFNAACVNVTVG